jgi:drug/metabolite transporter (DMT)-like permease
MPVNNRLKNQGRLAMFMGGFLMGFVGLFVNALEVIPTMAIVSLRGLFAAIILFSIILLSKKHLLVKILFKNLPFLLILQGVLSALTILFYFYSIQNVGYGTAAFMLYTGPIFAVLFMWIFLHRKPTKRDLIGFLIAIIGIAILTKPYEFIGFSADSSTGGMSSTFIIGILSGLLSGLFLGSLNTVKVKIFEVFDKKKEKIMAENKIDKEFNLMFLNMTIAAIATSVIFLVFVIPSAQYYKILTPTHWLIAVGLGLIPTAIAFTLINYGLKQDKAGDVLIFSYSETIVGASLTAILDLNLEISLIIGGILIIIANLLIALKKSEKK